MTILPTTTTTTTNDDNDDNNNNDNNTNNNHSDHNNSNNVNDDNTNTNDNKKLPCQVWREREREIKRRHTNIERDKHQDTQDITRQANVI